MELLEQVNKIFLNNEIENSEKFNSLNLQKLSIKNFSDILNKKLFEWCSLDYLSNELSCMDSFINCYYLQNKDSDKIIENVIYSLLIKWLKECQSYQISSVENGKKIINILIKKISKNKLNYYDQFNNTSVFRELLLNSSNIKLIEIFIDNGLEVSHLDGLNPYFFVLNSSSDANIITQSLYENNIPLPESHWSYIFNLITDSEKGRHENKTHLLNLEPKKFIVDEINELSVWNKIIKKGKYDLIKYLSEDMYKPHFSNGKNILDEMIENKSLILPIKLEEKIYKLLENKKDIEKFWDSINFPSLCYNYYISLLNIFREMGMDSEQDKQIEGKVSQLESIFNNSEVKKFIDTCYEDLYVNNKMEKNQMDYSDFQSILYLKTNLHFSKEMKNEVDKYVEIVTNKGSKQEQLFKSEARFIYHYKKQKTNTYLGTIEKDFCDYIKSFDSEKLVKLKKEFLETLDNLLIFDFNEIEDDVEVTSIEEDIALFTKESVEIYLEDNKDSENEVIKKYISIFKNDYKKNQFKTLAKSSVLLGKMDHLYETFPHFEKAITHIENLMILQNNGDKSFYIPPLLLGGGAGVGKTFFCDTISKLVNTKFELLNMESMTANFILTGSHAQWSGAEPGKIFKSLFNKENTTMNPIFLLDELDKARGDSRYSVMNSLLPLLERYTAKRFKDEFINLEIDASYINWFATANDFDKISIPVKNRFDMFSIPNPNPQQRKSLIRAIYQTVRVNNTWGHYFNENLPNETLDALAALMAPGAARDLRKSITTACSKAIRESSKELLPNHLEIYEVKEKMPWDIVL